MTESAKQLTPFTQLKQSMTAFSGSLKGLLPSNVSEDKFIKLVMNGIAMHEQKEKIINADRQSLFSAVSKCAADGLVLDGREATLVSYRNSKKGVDVVQYIPMVQGLIKKARNSGEISKIEAYVIYANDDFRYEKPAHDEPFFAPDWLSNDRGEPRGAYCVITLKDGEKIISIMPRKRILDIAGAGRNLHQYDPKSGAHFEEWWKKTVVRNALKMAPSSSDLQKVVESDNEGEFDQEEWKQTKQEAEIVDIKNAEQKSETKQKTKKTKVESIIEADFEAEEEQGQENATPKFEV